MAKRKEWPFGYGPEMVIAPKVESYTQTLELWTSK